jgi:hypothetical protein
VKDRLVWQPNVSLSLNAANGASCAARRAPRSLLLLRASAVLRWASPHLPGDRASKLIDRARVLALLLLDANPAAGPKAVAGPTWRPTQQRLQGRPRGRLAARRRRLEGGDVALAMESIRSTGEYPRSTRRPIKGRRAQMVIAADYPFMDVLWSMIIFFFWVIWIWIVITVLIDVFRRDDIGGWAKAAWVIFVVILPWLGVLIYLIVEHDGMRERSMQQAQAQKRELDDYVRDTAGGGSAGEIAKAKELLDAGAITQDEFQALKAKAIA